MEARAEAGVRRMEAGWGVRTGEAVGFLEEVVLLGCSVSKVAGVEHCGSLQTVRGEGWKRTEKNCVIDVSIFIENLCCNFVLKVFDDVMNKRPKNKKMSTGIRSLHI